MERQKTYEFLSTQRLGVVSSVAPDGTPQSAVVGFAVTPQLEIVFDTLAKSRKARNLFQDARCSFTVWSGEATVQLDGIAHTGISDGLREQYFERWPECRAHLEWPGITYFVIRPKWIRFSDYDCRPPEIVEFNCDQ